MTITAERQLVSASTVCGYRVRNRDNEDIGTVEEMIIDPRTGTIAWAVLSPGISWSNGDKLVALPWSMLALNVRDRALMVDVDRDVLDNAPGFDPNEWPDFGDERWAATVHNYYHGLSPAA